MENQAITRTLNNICKKASDIADIAKTAKRNGKSLDGHNFYGDKFREALRELAKLENSLSGVASQVFDDDHLTEFRDELTKAKRSVQTARQRSDVVHQLQMICQSKLIPALDSRTASTIPKSEQILTMDVVKGTRGYLSGCIQQANGCYEHQWYYACAVMIRKFFETLIIETFEAHGLDAKIKNKDGDFLMLRDLIDKLLEEPSWNLGRETKRHLPDIKALGDRSAHSRRFLAKKKDVDDVRSHIRIIAEELIHLASYKAFEERDAKIIKSSK